MTKKKIINDPVYGFVQIPYEIIYDLIQHPLVQRLRRIKQLGLTHMVYPGAMHSRFHHALGAMHLMTLTISLLREKGVAISEQEAEAACIAILLHDIGHGPFSHSLEGLLIPMSHERIGSLMMQHINQGFGGALDMAIQLFEGTYPRPFLCNLISSQLDLDRMDYLNRDSFYTGVIEGKIGYNRLIQVMTVKNDQLLIEEKGIHSIEKFLMARKIMYWQVYLHKSAVVAEGMLKRFIRQVLIQKDPSAYFDYDYSLSILSNTFNEANIATHLEAFSHCDDANITFLVKNNVNCGSNSLKLLANGLINRNLFSVTSGNKSFVSSFRSEVRQKVSAQYNLSESEASGLIWEQHEKTSTYQNAKNEIHILRKSGEVVTLSDYFNNPKVEIAEKYFFCHPKV